MEKLVSLKQPKNKKKFKQKLKPSIETHKTYFEIDGGATFGWGRGNVVIFVLFIVIFYSSYGIIAA